MGFTELNFLLRFLPVFFLIYYVSPSKYRNIILFLASIVFIAFGNWKNLAVLLGITVIDYILLFIMRNHRDLSRKLLFGAMLVIDLGVLLYFKYIVQALPLGISFYTFMAISCGVDIYYGKASIGSFAEFGAYLTMFPKLVQGPIVQYRDIKTQLKERSVSWTKMENGLEEFVIGLAFKTMIADKIAILWNDVRMIGFDSISTPMAWLGAMAFSMELYFDFWGYSIMAVGLGKMMGFDLPHNFDHPYASATVSEYYRRWHITLGKWFRDYVYIPLGGNRVGKARLLINLLVVWALTGIWHGVTLNYLLWAGVLVLFIILEKFVYGKFLQEHRIISTVYIWLIIPLTWVIFAITDFKSLGVYFTRLFPFWGTGEAVNTGDFIYYGKDFVLIIIAAFVVSLPQMNKLYNKFKDYVVFKLLLIGVFWFCAYQIHKGANNPFMYSGF